MRADPLRKSSFGEGFYPIAPESSGQEGPWETPSFATPDGAPNQSADDFEPAARTRLEAWRPFAPHPEGEPARRGVSGLWPPSSGSSSRLSPLPPISCVTVPRILCACSRLRRSIPGEAGAGGKIVDRIVAGTATPGSPAASVSGPSATAGHGNDAQKRLLDPPIRPSRRPPRRPAHGGAGRAIRDESNCRQGRSGGSKTSAMVPTSR